MADVFARLMAAALVGAALVGAALVPGGSAPASAAAARETCASVGALGGEDVFVAGNINVSNNQLQGGAAAGKDVTLRSFGISVGLPADASRLDLIAGGSLDLANASAHGSVRYGGTLTGSISVPAGGSVAHGPYPFDFAEEIARMQLLSATWGELAATGSAKPSGETLALSGSLPGLNVFDVTAGQLQGARSITIGVPPGASALVNVTGASYSTAVSGAYGAGNAGVPTVWNFTEATRVQVGPGLEWFGTVLAPKALATASNTQLHGYVWAHDWEGTGTILHAPLPACLPPPPAPAIELAPLCVDTQTNELAMRLRNTAQTPRTVTWRDEQSAQHGTIDAGAATDSYFHVQDGDQPHTIVASSGSEHVRAEGTMRPCRGTIRVHKSTSGEGTPPAGPWNVKVSGDNGYTRTAGVAAGGTTTFTVPGAYRAGTVPIDAPPVGYLYTVSEPDPRGAVATVAPELVEIVDGQDSSVQVDNRYEPVEPDVKPGPPVEPPAPLPGEPPLPPLQPAAPGHPAADLVITERVSRTHVPLHGTFETTVEIRNLGQLPSEQTVVAELPQSDPLQPNRIIRVLSVGAGAAATCTLSRPVRCELGTLPVGADVLIHARVKALVLGSLTSVVRVSSATPEVNTTNNIATAGIVVTPPPTHLTVGVSAPAQSPVGVPMSYRVRASGGSLGAAFVRICQRPPAGLSVTSARGTFRRHGSICRDVDRIARRGSAGFTVEAIPMAAVAGRTLVLPATASAPGLATAHGSDAVAIHARRFEGNG